MYMYMYTLHVIISAPPLDLGGGWASSVQQGGGGMEELVPVVWARGGMGMRCPVVLDVKPWFGTFISEFI